jgi:hypothetical protein
MGDSWVLLPVTGWASAVGMPHHKACPSIQAPAFGLL